MIHFLLPIVIIVYYELIVNDYKKKNIFERKICKTVALGNNRFDLLYVKKRTCRKILKRFEDKFLSDSFNNCEANSTGGDIKYLTSVVCKAVFCSLRAVPGGSG